MWPQLTGDFYRTLQECDSLLSDHGYMRSGRNNISSNFRWWFTAESNVDNLMARLRFHITKVEFYTRPAEFDAIVRSGSEIQQLRRQVARLERLMVNGPDQSENIWAKVVSNELKARLESEFQTNSPSWSVKDSEWPLKEAFEALVFHFEAGTVKFNPAPDLNSVPDLSQYLGLAKSIWILEEIKKSHNFQAAGTDSIWADRIRQFEDDLRGQLYRFEAGELEKPSMQEVLELPTGCYSISSGGIKYSDPLNAREAGPLEEKILEIPLPSDSSDRESVLVVFREGETDFRLVTSTKQADNPMAQYDKELEVNMDRHRLVPAYANPFQGSLPRHNLLLYNERGRKPKEFVFLSHEDLKLLQRALTGYRIHHDMPVTRWCMNESKRPCDSGNGILQLWQFKPLPPISATSPSKVSDTNSSIGSPGSPVPSFCSAKRSPAKRADLAARNRQNEASIDSADSCESSHMPAIGTHGSHTYSFTELMNTQVSDGSRHLTRRPATSRCDGLGTILKGQSCSPATILAAVSNGSHDERRNSSAFSSGTSVSRSSVMSPVRGSQNAGVQFLKAELPVLMILTLCNERYSFIHVTCKS